eukprot:1147466-Amphidinium_carterae.1
MPSYGSDELGVASQNWAGTLGPSIKRNTLRKGTSGGTGPSRAKHMALVRVARCLSQWPVQDCACCFSHFRSSFGLKLSLGGVGSVGER